jgi:hypothetical protein
LWCASGCSPDALQEIIERMVGGSWTLPERRSADDEARNRERRQAAALKLWNGSAPALGTIADVYLAGRGLPRLAGTEALRFRADCSHPEESGRYAAMVALVQDIDGKPIGIHRTYLRRDGSRKPT